MSTNFIVYVTIAAIVLLIVGLYLIRRYNNRLFDRYRKDNERKWRALKDDIEKKSRPVTNYMPIIGFEVYQYPGEKPSVIISKNIDEVSDLFGSVLRDNKELRDMIKLSFRKANKTLA